MKHFYPKLALIAFIATMFASCEDTKETVAVTETYKIRCAVGIDSYISTSSVAIDQLADFAAAQLQTIDAKYGKAAWTITAEGETKEAAAAEADR